MQCVELNPKGHFDPWDQDRIEELAEGDITKELGQKLVFENERIRLWQIYILPGERMPFRRHGANYSWECTTGGLALTRHATGRISMIKLDKGDTDYWEYSGKPYINDLENIGPEPLEIQVLEHIVPKEDSDDFE